MYFNGHEHLMNHAMVPTKPGEKQSSKDNGQVEHRNESADNHTDLSVDSQELKENKTQNVEDECFLDVETFPNGNLPNLSSSNLDE